MSHTNSDQLTPALYDCKAAAAWLSVSEAWLRKAVTAGTVPYRRLGPRKVRFTLDDLQHIVAASAAGSR